MPQFILDHGDESATRWLATCDDFINGYVQCIFFTSTGYPENGDLENASVAELADETKARIVEDCARFASKYESDLERAYEREYTAEQAGRDFWFTRNGHGCGFWDRRVLEGYLGETLTTHAHEFGEIDLYRGDDGKLYLA